MTTPNEGLRIFLSYASEEGSLAEQIYLTLCNSGHEVFFDRTNLPPGQDFNPSILNAIRSSDLMVFLISPHSVQDGAYARTELRFARETWPNPAGRILPVMAAATEFSMIPAYVRAVTILMPEGNLPAEVAAAINDLAADRTPEDTLAGQVELIRSTARETAELRVEQQLARIELAWERTRKSYVHRINGIEVVPSYGLAVLVALVGIGIAIFSWESFTRRDPEFFGIAPIVLPLVLTGPSSIYIAFRARAYKKSEAAYHELKRLALASEPDDEELPPA
jgi:hypothetical protein